MLEGQTERASHELDPARPDGRIRRHFAENAQAAIHLGDGGCPPLKLLVINLARQADYLAFSKNPNELEERLAIRKERGTLVVLIDEIQRIPDLLNTIQVLFGSEQRAL